MPYIMMLRLLILLLCISIAPWASASNKFLTAMVINAEWFWTPHDGHADGSKFNRGDPQPRQYQEELAFYAGLINKVDANLVALIEIENRLVAKDLAAKLGKNWNIAFKQGRDTATGQDVALISSLPLIVGSVTDFNFPEGRIAKEKKGKRLSKVVGASYRVGDRIVGAITSHFLSKRNDSKRKANNRLRQADGLAIAARVQRSSVDAQIVLGDFNDYRRSAVLARLSNKAELNLVENKASSVKHILHSGMKPVSIGGERLQPYSDHSAIWVRFELP